MKNRLYRSRFDKVVGGVCGGLGQYLSIDPILIRLFFVLLAVVGNGAGVLIYILMMIVIPENPEELPPTASSRPEQEPGERIQELGAELQESAERLADRARTWSNQVGGNENSTRNAIFIGGFLVLIGFLFLLRNFSIPWLDWLNLNTLWPLLLILGGGVMLWRYYKGE